MTTTLHATGDAPVSAPAETPAPVRPSPGTPLWVACAILGTAFLGGAVLAFEPGQNAVDSWGFSVFSTLLQTGIFHAITDLGLGPVTAAVAVVGGAITWTRDRRRTLACLGGPALAVELAEVMKMVVGRKFEGALCWPSGSAAAVAAMVTVITLVTRGAARWVVIVLGSGAVVLEVIAVVAFRWHYLSDALGGVLVGVGSVLLVDAVVHRIRWPGRRPSVRSEPV